MKVTRILKSKKLNQGKYEQLEEQAKRLGKVRSEVWYSFGSIGGVSIKSDRKIRDQWLKEKHQFNVSANAWKETLRDSFNNNCNNWGLSNIKERAQNNLDNSSL